MYSLKDFFSVLNAYAPLTLSQKMIEKGCYDNSGILINCCEKVSGAVFSLDLSKEAVIKAEREKCNVIVTHHPAIYKPISTLSIQSPLEYPLMRCVGKGITVISMHLNLDVADGGIDHCLAERLGAESYKIIDAISEKEGYGREFSVETTTLGQLTAKMKKYFSTTKILTYGKGEVHKIASFCGAGGNEALTAVKNGKTNADLIVTSDLAHHEIKGLIDMGKKVMVLPHYVAEEYGFNRYYERVKNQLNGQIKTVYLDDKRYR